MRWSKLYTKKLVSMILFVLLPLFLNYTHDNTVFIKHKNYDVLFSKEKKVPLYVKWTVFKTEIDCNRIDRKGIDFTTDNTIETNYNNDYKNSHFDKGHISPAADNSCDSIEFKECFYYTNCAPQYPELNRKIWKKLEDKCRKYVMKNDSITIISGSVCSSNLVIGDDYVSVPTNFYKIVIDKRHHKFFIVYIPNTPMCNEFDIPEYTTSFPFLKRQLNFDITKY